MDNENRIQDIIKLSQKKLSLGLILYKAAKDVVTFSSPLGIVPQEDFLSSSQKNSRIIMSYACGLVMTRDDDSDMSDLELFRLGFFDLILPNFAAEFLKKFHTLELAEQKFPRLISLAEFVSKDSVKITEQILNLSVEEAKMLIEAKPLIEDFKDSYISEVRNNNRTQNNIIGNPQVPPKPPEPKRSGGKINLWLDWYHSMQDNGYKCTLEDVANKSGYSLGYIKQRHMIYQAKPNQNT